MAEPGRSSSPQPLPSIPPSPSEENDLGIRKSPQSDDEADEEQGMSTQGSSTRLRSKGKDKAGPFHAFDEEEEDEPPENAAAEGYPPTSGDDNETRRIEENLRRWEVAERQRRKAVRDSSLTHTPPSSIIDVARRASSLWPGSGSRSRPAAATAGVGTHHALQTSEDAVPLEDIDGGALSPIPSPSPTPPPGAHRAAQNPFADPAGSSSSLFVNDMGAVPDAADDDLETPRATRFPGDAQAPPRPEPLGLPKPRSPPPRTSTPHASRPPEPIPPPRPTPQQGGDDDEKPVRWWTDWLCGCREDGDVQAGRTNPLE
ncbi:hypothetical protein DENSPDRAFT_881660 [Dentipellis sp. KUC8613]|nr:hypothetical protein DENSPDRAFT_881660 [Dentipellis sp. KUC8613]